LGSALGILLHQRGLLVLHSSALAVAGGAVCFLGAAGSGKSTLAAGLNARGIELVADDLVPVEFDAAGSARTRPGFPQLKLYPASARAVGVDPQRLPRIDPNFEKRTHRVDSLRRDPLPVHWIYVLAYPPPDQAQATGPWERKGARGEDVTITLLPRADALVELIRHSFVVRLLAATGASARHLRQCSQLAAQVPVYRLQRPRDLAALDAVVSLVLEDVSARVPAAAPAPL
jgi:hypothetical protein